ncbi:hypothetical protein HU200_048617 [Digitaria exilis]|uniref:KIB1-4 beta-propeller domain-containing protein n=1 Tax=Digitaria exilis TaxID=1010633 RepID=A0A835E7I3_9POAL|nr:hypothetical protein HU200_048617 [Digitaria exilis]
MILRRLCRQFLRAIPKILTFSPNLLKALQRIDLAHDPPRSPIMEADIAGAESPELPVDILMNIFALLEIPDLLRGGSAFVFFDGSAGSHIVVLIHHPYALSFARAGDSRWTWLPACDHFEDCIYVDGVLYAVTATSAIHAFDLTGPTYSMKVIMEKKKRFIVDRIYITQAPSGELLLVWRDQNLKGDAEDCDTSEFMEGSQKFMLFVVDMEAKELQEIDSLDDHLMFLGYSQSCCLDAEEYPSLKANHVYLTGDERDIGLLKWDHRDIFIFSTESNNLQEIVPPQCRCSWPVPIWLTPNLSKMN